MFFNKSKKNNPVENNPIEYESYPASGVDFEESSSESYTNNLPNHTVINNRTWGYEKMEDVPFPVGEDWEWIDCYKALYKTYYISNDKVEYVGPNQNFVYELNRVYSLPEEGEFGKIDYCGNGFHACLTVKDALTWYNYISYDTFAIDSYNYGVAVKLVVVAKAKLLVNKKDLANCYGKTKLDDGKVVGKAIILTGFVNPKEVYDNRKEDRCWSIGVLNGYAYDYLKAICKKEGINLNVLKKLIEKLEITCPYYEKMLGFIDDKNISTMAYVKAMLDAYRINSKEIYQCLNMSYGQVLTEEIINNLDYQFAMRLADNDDAYNRSLSVAEKMQILYSHKIALK
jgi:hypothetical protein